MFTGASGRRDTDTEYYDRIDIYEEYTDKMRHHVGGPPPDAMDYEDRTRHHYVADIDYVEREDSVEDDI